MTIATVDEQGVTLLIDDEGESFMSLVSLLRKVTN
jgi:hypothetical protein